MNNTQISEYLTHIAQQLYKESKTIDNIGLLNGKMGIALFFFLYSRYFNDKEYELYANEIIDDIYEIIAENALPNYADGLAGFGTCIEFLAKQQFIDANTDEVLEDLDEYLHYRIPLFSGNIDFINGIGGIANYFTMRLNNTSYSSPKITNKNMEVLSQLSDMFGNNPLNSYRSAISFINTFSDLYKLNINMPRSKKYLNYAIDKIETMVYEDRHFGFFPGEFNPLNLAYELFRTAKKTKNDEYKEKAILFLDKYEVEFRKFLAHKQMGVISGHLKWSFLYKYIGTELQNREYLEESEKWLSKYYSDYSFDKTLESPLSIMEGITGNGILLLSLLKMEEICESVFDIIPLFYEKAVSIQ